MYQSVRKVDGEVVKQDEMQSLYEGLATKYRNLFIYGTIVGPLDREDNWNPGFTADTIIVGSNCYSMGAMLLAAGEPGRRYVYPNAHTMLHLPSGTTRVDAKQVEIQSKEMQKVKRTLVGLIKEWGVSKEERTIMKDIDREFYLDAEETIEYGLADKFITQNTFKGK